ncbi:T9SS type A sorting domain-containing protein, partial [Hymenobacter terrenus]|uniref:T9SS type A sorting domain-containing protein n=1 Tax=Hymenobacter terrenus TaxID=1629124 RepID=UPI00061947A2
LTVPSNDEPCGALALGTAPLSSTNLGATTSLQNGIVNPDCSPSQLPKDVWFALTPTAPTATLSLSGSAAGTLRLFTAPDCAAGPFLPVFCQASGAPNTALGTVTIPGLTPGQRYYLAISGFASNDAPGPFTIAGTGLLTATAAPAPDQALELFPNPSSTGLLTLRRQLAATPAQATLLNALGQVVRTLSLPAGALELLLSTRGLAPGLYTLRLTDRGQTLTRKVVLE